MLLLLRTMKKFAHQVWQFISGGVSHSASQTDRLELPKSVAMAEAPESPLAEIHALEKHIQTVTTPPSSAETLHLKKLTRT